MSSSNSSSTPVVEPPLARVQDVFDAVVDLAPADRLAKLQELCGDDAALKAEVQSFLDAHDDAGEFLAAPTVASAAPPAVPIASKPPEQIGPYHILKMLGEGGYGTVYLAEQHQPLRRTVALKVIKAGMDTQQVIARFQLERQTVALMDHPHIARVYDAGETENGRPYFVMEYVEGPTVTQYCRERQLKLEDRLAIFDAVCAAVQHAHRKGVIHRDLKPSNVLVATVDGKPVPKVIDFGIAKALNTGDAADIALTQHALFIGTPQYMSPEQAQGPSADIDTRSDVYSLGVLLYELLTDSSPIDPVKIRKAMLADLPRLIRESEPPPPSSRVRARNRSLSAGAGSSDGDSTGVTRSVERIRGDLDWIVLKALAKEPDRRYASAEALAEDLARYRRDEPVTAGPPSRAYWLRKFARRHRRLIVSGAAVMASLVIGLTVAVVALYYAQQDRDRAIAAKASEAQQRQIADQQRIAAQASAAEAKAHAAKVLAAQTFLYRMIAPSMFDDSSPIPPRTVIDYVEFKADDGFLKDHPEVEAPLRLGLGSAYLGLQVPAKAETQYRRATELYQQLEGAESQEVASAMHNWGFAVFLQNDAARAKPILTDSLKMYRRLLHGDKLDDAPVMAHLGLCLARDGDPAAGEPLLREALALFKKAYPPQHPQVVSCADWLGEVYEKLGEKEKAAQARAAAKPTLGTSPPKVDALREAALEWVRDNMAFEPDSTFPQAISDQLEKHTTHDSEFSVMFGADLLRSHHATRLSSVLGQLVPVEMSDEQADAMHYGRREFGVSMLRWPGKRLAAEATLDEPQFDGGGEWDGLTPLTGRVVIRPHKPLEPGNYALHLTWSLKNVSFVIFSQVDATKLDGDKPVEFKFAPIPNDASTRPSLPAVRVVYMDLVRNIYTGKHPDIAVISPTRGFLLTHSTPPATQTVSRPQ